jgi:hypothetical protein
MAVSRSVVVILMTIFILSLAPFYANGMLAYKVPEKVLIGGIVSMVISGLTLFIYVLASSGSDDDKKKS